jgi:hypothetical protein
MPFTFHIESFIFAIELSIYRQCVNDCPRIVRCQYLVAFGVFFSGIFDLFIPTIVLNTCATRFYNFAVLEILKMRQIYAVSYPAIGTKSKYKIVSHFRVFRQVAQNLTLVQNSNPMSHSESCALDVNGNLMEASEISWQYDPDDPQPPNLTNTSTSTSSTPAPSNVFDVLMDKGHAPSNVVAGTRRSARVPKPAQKIRDRDAVTLATSARRPSHHVLRVTSDDEDDIYMDDGDNRDTDNDSVERG